MRWGGTIPVRDGFLMNYMYTIIKLCLVVTKKKSLAICVNLFDFIIIIISIIIRIILIITSSSSPSMQRLRLSETHSHQGQSRLSPCNPLQEMLHTTSMYALHLLKLVLCKKKTSRKITSLLPLQPSSRVVAHKYQERTSMSLKKS